MTILDLARRTKIVATIGPATESASQITKLIEAGATTFRLNFSHGDHVEHALRIKTIREVASTLNVNIGILQDLQGPKIRLGRFKEGPISLKKGDTFKLTSEKTECNQQIANVTYNKLIAEVSEGKRILLDDGRVEMVVEKVDKLSKSLICKVTVGGILSNNKGVNFPDVQLSIKALTEKDKRDLAFGLSQGVDWVALSFVREPSDIQEIKKEVKLPILCKDFIYDEYQLYLARAFGADAILIILKGIGQQHAVGLRMLAKDLGLAVIYEVHTTLEAKQIAGMKDVILGINNRNLETLETNIENTFNVYDNVLSKQRHPGLIVCESGIKSEKEVEEIVKKTKINNFLIGESLLKDLDKKTSLLHRIVKISP